MHGEINVRGFNAPRSQFHNEGRFGRLFPELPPFGPDTEKVREALRELGKVGGLMDGNDRPGGTPQNEDNPKLSAGFTFLGQFIDHDLTFDPTSSLERQNDPEAIANFRTPSLELDNVYGSGPTASPHLYDVTQPGKFLVETFTDPTGTARSDMPRNSQLTALIGDPRNDENLMVSQLHVAFLRFHNAIVDDLAGKGLSGAQLFAEAQRLARWHYQWMILTEFLPRTVGEDILESVRRTHPRERLFQWRNEPFMPVEFAVAAYRFGHSQVRPGYRVNAGFAAGIFNSTLPFTDPDPNDLRGGKRAPRRFVDWRFFFRVDAANPPALGKRIDTKLSSPLFALIGANPESLAQRNLLRGLSFNLPSGQAMARALRIKPLTPEELADVKPLGFDKSTPPWYYILKEAEVRSKGEKLGPLGGRIVAEVFMGILQGDRHAFINREPDWKPIYGEGNEFTIGHLLRFAGVA
jgi:hypothetical protein